MPAFGENLRREREMRGVSLEEISAATKISLRFLDAIEREDFSKLPGGIFSRSFLRSYARYLGLDEERVVADFQLAARPQMEFDLHRMPAGSANVPQRATRTPLIATLVAILLLAGGYALFRYSTRSSEAQAPILPPPVTSQNPPPSTTPVPSAPGDATAPPAPAPGGVTPGTESSTPTVPGAAPVTPGNTPNSQSTTPPAAANSANPAPPQTAASPTNKLPLDGDLVLQVAATERAWVAIDSDGKTVLQRVLNPNEVETLKAHKSFDITTGNAQAIILTLNGETREPLGRRGEVKSVHLTREDLKTSSP
jgi:cytoskeleton protein RodZ